MTNFSIEDQIWNRAALESGGDSPLDGDQSLTDFLYFHGMAMNGGLGHAYDVLSDVELAAAIEGFRFFGFEGLAEFLETTSLLSEDDQEGLSWKYAEFIPADEALVQSFKEYYRQHPQEFAPRQIS